MRGPQDEHSLDLLRRHVLVRIRGGFPRIAAAPRRSGPGGARVCKRPDVCACCGLCWSHGRPCYRQEECAQCRCPSTDLYPACGPIKARTGSLFSRLLDSGPTYPPWDGLSNTLYGRRGRLVHAVRRCADRAGQGRRRARTAQSPRRSASLAKQRSNKQHPTSWHNALRGIMCGDHGKTNGGSPRAVLTL